MGRIKKETNSDEERRVSLVFYDTEEDNRLFEFLQRTSGKTSTIKFALSLLMYQFHRNLGIDVDTELIDAYRPKSKPSEKISKSNVDIQKEETAKENVKVKGNDVSEVDNNEKLSTKEHVKNIKKNSDSQLISLNIKIDPEKKYENFHEK